MYENIFAKYGYYTLETVAGFLMTVGQTDKWTDGQTVAIAIPPLNFLCGGCKNISTFDQCVIFSK